jgi:DNA polymerase-3 subunit delta
MQVRPSDLTGHLARGLSRLYVISGDEALLVIEAADAIRRAARSAGYLERDLLQAAARGFDWGSLAAATQSMSLFAEKKLIELRLPSGKPGTEGARALVAHASASHEDILTLVILPRIDAAARKSAWFSALEDHGTSISIAKVDGARLPAFIEQRLAQQQQSADPQTLAMMAERVEGNLLAAYQEIQKLALLCPTGRLSASDVEQAVARVARYNVFELRDVILKGDLARLSRMFEGLRQEGESPVLVHWALTDQIRTLAQAERALASGKRLGDIARELRLWDGREQLVAQALKRLKRRVLEEALLRAAELERAIKGLRIKRYSGDAWSEMLQLASTLCLPARKIANG